MKFFLFSALALTMLFSCQNENSLETKSQPETSFSTARVAPSYITIEDDETPELDATTLQSIGITNFVLDTSRNAELDINNSILTVPYASTTTLNSSAGIRAAEMGIKIAKKNIKPKDIPRCSSCVNCTGFRCDFSVFTVHTMDGGFTDRIDSNRVDSEDREQELFAFVDTTNNVVTYYFKNNVNWVEVDK